MIARDNAAQGGGRKRGEDHMSDGRPDFRMMHMMVRVLDLEKSIAFYTEVLGMKLLRKEDFPKGASPWLSSDMGPRPITR
jgi:hypothetical protein